ncbi:MAG: hypothetical protein M3177_02145 [Pseudomonadota bacterium]|nr:hypothetical protein [Pseudomonadota bacterium]
MRKVIALVLLLPLLHGCSYIYPVWATLIDGRLAFESGDSRHQCFTNIRVTPVGPVEPNPAIEAIENPIERDHAAARARDAWMTDAIATYECRGRFPVLYGAPMPGITVVPAKPLRIGLPYEVSVYGPRGASGAGCFRINADGRPENLPETDCFYPAPSPPPTDPAPSPPPPVPAPVVSAPNAAPEAPAPVAVRESAEGGMMMSNSPAPAAVTMRGPAPSAEPIDARPSPDRTGPSQMYALTPYRGIDRYLRDYPSLAACERARAAMRNEEAERRLCGFGPRRP